MYQEGVPQVCYSSYSSKLLFNLENVQKSQLFIVIIP